MKRENKKKTKSQKDDDSESDGGSVASTVEEMVVVCDDMINVISDVETVWVSDSGATVHATSRKDFFTSYTSGDFGIVKMGNNDKAKIIGNGDVHLVTANCTMLVLKFVRHAEGLRFNIISVGKLD